MIPIAVVRNGDGPTALLVGGNHGDEYEGPIALHKLAGTLRAEDVHGRVIIVPCLNLPAVMAGRRVSPIDGGNMNRAFPGRPDGTVTEKIADFVQRHLLPMADLVLDIHAGGRTLDFVPFACNHALPNKEQEERCAAARDAFAAPYAMTLLEMDGGGMLDTAAEAMGKVFVSTELGGGGTATARSVAIAERGVGNVLRHMGILEGAPEGETDIRLTMPDDACYVVGESNGLVEPCVDLGAWVEEGDVIARVYDPERTGGAPREYRAARSGVLVGRHFPGLTRTGDCLAALGVPESVEAARAGAAAVAETV